MRGNAWLRKDDSLNALSDGSHCNDHSLSLRITIVIEKTVVASCDLVYFLDIILDDLGNCVVICIGSLTMLEESIRVLCHTACDRSLGIEGARTEFGKSLLVDERSEILFSERRDLLNLV